MSTRSCRAPPGDVAGSNPGRVPPRTGPEVDARRREVRSSALVAARRAAAVPAPASLRPPPRTMGTSVVRRRRPPSRRPRRAGLRRRGGDLPDRGVPPLRTCRRPGPSRGTAAATPSAVDAVFVAASSTVDATLAATSSAVDATSAGLVRPDLRLRKSDHIRRRSCRSRGGRSSPRLPPPGLRQLRSRPRQQRPPPRPRPRSPPASAGAPPSSSPSTSSPSLPLAARDPSARPPPPHRLPPTTVRRTWTMEPRRDGGRRVCDAGGRRAPGRGDAAARAGGRAAPDGGDGGAGGRRASRPARACWTAVVVMVGLDWLVVRCGLVMLVTSMVEIQRDTIQVEMFGSLFGKALWQALLEGSWWLVWSAPGTLIRSATPEF